MSFVSWLSKISFFQTYDLLFIYTSILCCGGKVFHKKTPPLQPCGCRDEDKILRGTTLLHVKTCSHLHYHAIPI